SIFFFFQAEDGIRDFHVTGVQTCALPIFTRESKVSIPSNDLACNLLRRRRFDMSRDDVCARISERISGTNMAAETGSAGGVSERSEERRVGKERRCRVMRDQ